VDGRELLVGLGIDITDRKKAEEELLQLNQLRDSVIENANVWLNVLDRNANVVIWNKAAESISGFSRDEVIGNNKIWEWFYPDKKYRDEITAKAAAIIEQKEVLEDFETTICCKDGSFRIISWNSRNLIDQKGKPIGSIALGRDVSERKKAEKELNTRLNELEIFNKAAVDREIIINDLRKEINKLLKKLGKEEKYFIVT